MAEPLTTPHLWLVRHAQPLIAPGVCYGRLDVPADTDHTRSSALRLHSALPPRVTHIQSSPLRRCQQLADELRSLRASSAPVQLDVRLQEMDFGAWEDCCWDAIAREEIDAWTKDFAHLCPGQGESLQQMLVRVDQALQAACKQGKDAVWITHAGVIRCVLWLLQHGHREPLSSEWTMAAPAFGEWFHLPLTPP